MNNIITYIFIFGFYFQSQAQSPVEFVNPFIGTSNYGATHPGAAFPHAMASVSPFNSAFKKGEENPFEKDSEWHSRPYVNENKFLTGFSHVNLSGVGCPDLGSIILMPTTGSLEFDAEKHGSTFSNEVATPGYYSTNLTKHKIKAEMTSTLRTGLSRYTFPKGQSNVLLNLGLGLTNETGASLRIVSDTEIEGYKLIGTFCYNPEDVRPVYFVVQFSKPASDFGAWKKMPKYKGVEAAWVKYDNDYKPYVSYQYELAGEDIGTYFSFDTEENEQILVKVGISYVSIENARENLNTEQPNFDFEQTVARSKNKWDELLGRIQIESSNKDHKTIFYTALYHLLTHPNVINDVNGDYPLMSQYGTGNSGNKNRYTVFSLWDTYRNVHPFLSLVYPDIQSEMVQSMLEMYNESGWLPKWELLGMETEVMVGDPATPVIVDTYLRGIKDFDIQQAYEAIKKGSDTSENTNLLRPNIDAYNELGFIPEDTSNLWNGTVSTALEYYISDWNIAQLANALGNKKDYKRYFNKSMGYKNYFDPSTGMLRPKFNNQKWLTPFDPEKGKNFEAVAGYIEGNAWQYRFYVPHDIKGIIELNGGSKKFTEELQKCFDSDNYDMANEPDITYPYLFNYVKGEEWRTQQIVHELIDKHYTNTPDGIPGNDDTGTLSTWLLYSMLGIYPTCPGDMNYALTSPIFDKVTILLNQDYYSGKSLTIKKISQGENAIFIKEIRFNNDITDNYFINHNDLTQGGILEFDLVKNRKDNN